ncbi:MAG: flagellar biosynthesis protein FlhF [Bacteroidetes bacterium]|nr:flagellar biosynthesis protein FlhF [Bacteroidota bacterium]
MKIKKYVAPTLKEASQQMKKELGEQAIILSTRVIESDDKSGSRRLFEITSGIEDEHIPIMMKNMEKRQKSEAGDPSAFASELQKLAAKVYNEKPNITLDRDKNDSVNDRLRGSASGDQLKEVLKTVVDTLLENEVQRDIISLVLKQLKENQKFLDMKNVGSYVLSSIGSLIPTVNFEVNDKSKTKIVALVGPTGVGKTTSIAKLAVISKILHNLDIGLISIDTFRLGALDQLRIFSEVSNIEMLVAYEEEEMPKLLNSFKKKDIVFIDTIGRSQNNPESLNKSKKFLDSIDIDEITLVLSATNSTKNLMSVAKKFKIFNYNSLLFTKIDEAVSYGNILNVASSMNVPTMFLTNGQVIPDDIISADPGMMAKLIYTGAMGS